MVLLFHNVVPVFYHKIPGKVYLYLHTSPVFADTRSNKKQGGLILRRMIISAAACLLMLLLCLNLVTPAMAEGTAPIAENLELKTYRHISVGGRLSAYDPDGGEVRFQITTPPTKGDVQLEEDGSFVYSPYYNKKGRDYFGYKAQDAEGNLSQEATVLIRIEKQKTPVWYEDMQGRQGEYAAISLAERGYFVGESIGGHYCFQPDKPMTRGEFLSVCMLAAKKPLLQGVMRSGCADDASLPDWMREVVASASLQGLAHVERFQSSEPIDTAEAVVILNTILNLYPETASGEDATLRACMNLQAVGVPCSSAPGNSLLTREEAALMLEAAAAFAE